MHAVLVLSCLRFILDFPGRIQIGDGLEGEAVEFVVGVILGFLLGEDEGDVVGLLEGFVDAVVGDPLRYALALLL